MIGLVYLLGAGLVGALAAVITMAVLSRKDAREVIAARDLLDGEREQHRKTRGELDAETAAHAVTTDELRKEKDLRASAESDRNTAWKDARDHIVEQINSSGIADAAHLGNRILSAPLPGTKLSESGPDALIDPNL